MSRKYSVIGLLTKLSTISPNPNLIPTPTPTSTPYDLYYPQFVDSKEPLSELQDKDVTNWNEEDIKRASFKDMPDENRVDYFDIAYGPDPLNTLDIHHLKGDGLRPVVFYMHGGGWASLSKEDSKYAGPTWLSMGYTLVSINYRLGPKDRHPAQIEDCAMALKWVIDNIANYGGDPNHIAITGHSAGGHLTALLACGKKWHEKYDIDMRKVKCWIAASGVYDFNLPENYYHSWMPGFMSALMETPEQKDEVSPVKYVTGDEPPCLILQGGDDWLVPKTNAIALYNKLREKGTKHAELDIIKGYWHCNMIVDYGEPHDKPTKEMNKFLKKYLPVTNDKEHDKCSDECPDECSDECSDEL